MKINYSKVIRGIGCTVAILAAAAVNAQDESRTQSQRPLSDVGNWLKNNGIRPHLITSYLYFDNFDMGIAEGHNEQLWMIMAGFDADLRKSLGINGGHFHFSYAWAPYHKNFDFGSRAGDVLVGNPPPYVPKVAHLTKLTYERKLFDDRLTIEAGRSNPGFYYGKSLCNFEFSCVNPLLHKTATFSPIIYSAWGGRVSYKILPTLEFSLSGWRTYLDFPFTNGWENGWNDKHPTGNLWLAGLSHGDEGHDGRNKYPLTWELTFFHNTHRFNNNDPTGAGETVSGTSGMHAGVKKLFWRADGGSDAEPGGATLAAYGSFSHMFDEVTLSGLSSFASVGLILQGPFKSRPMDSYGLNLNRAKMTKGEQRLMNALYTGNDGWTPHKNEYQLSLDATVPILPEVILQASIGRVWHTNTWMNTNTGQTVSSAPKDGYSASLGITVLLDKALGLVD